jgi:mono/diheme cytochrome c family protein
MTWRVIVGTIAVMITMIALGFVAVTEQDRMGSFERAYDSRQVEVGAALFDSNCAMCHGAQGEGTPRAPSLNAVDLFNGARLAQIGWAGTIENFVRTTIAGGRPRPSATFEIYPERMPTWSEEFGGPLRKDQVDALTAFVMNWGEAFRDPSGNFVMVPTATPLADAVGTDINVELPAGNAENGKAVAERVGIACNVCHVGATLIGPAWFAEAAADGKGVGTHAQERYQSADYTGNAASPEQYLLESIVQPDAYIVPGGTNFAINGVSVMPKDFGAKLTRQDAADIIAYLLTLR